MNDTTPDAAPGLDPAMNAALADMLGPDAMAILNSEGMLVLAKLVLYERQYSGGIISRLHDLYARIFGG